MYSSSSQSALEVRRQPNQTAPLTPRKLFWVCPRYPAKHDGRNGRENEQVVKEMCVARSDFKDTPP